MNADASRLNGADFVRASACFIVLFHHLAQRINPRSALGDYDASQVFNVVGGFGVAMFFVLSGFLLARPFWKALDQGRPLPSLHNYALRRAARIIPGFWLALTVSFILSITLFGFALDGWLVLRYVAGLLLVSDWHWTTLFPVEINGPLWSIGFEVSSYVMLPLGFMALFALYRGRHGGWAARLNWLGVLAVTLLAHWLFVRFVPVDTEQSGFGYGLQGGARGWMPRFNPFGFFAIFAMGALASGVQLLVGRYRSVLFDVLSLGAIALVAVTLWEFGLREGGTEGFGWLGVPYLFPSFPLMIGFVLVVTPSSLVVGRVLDNPVIRYLAEISFGIYVWHYLVLEVVRMFWWPDIGHGRMGEPVQFLLGSAVIIGITMVIATLSYRWMEAPIIAWARTLEKRPVAPETVGAAV